jgi:hypothetical protein
VARRRRCRRGVWRDRLGAAGRARPGARARRAGTSPCLLARGDGGCRAPRQHRVRIRHWLHDRVRMRPALLNDALAHERSTLDAIVALHVGLLSAQPDTLIAGKVRMPWSGSGRSASRHAPEGPAASVSPRPASCRRGGTRRRSSRGSPTAPSGLLEVPRAAWLDFRIRIGGRMGLVRDIPHAGEEIKRDAAVCTLVSARATCPSSSNAERACWQRSQTR